MSNTIDNHLISKLYEQSHVDEAPPSEIDELFYCNMPCMLHVWRDRRGNMHRDNDKPAVVLVSKDNESLSRKVWFVHGKHHRENNKPAIVDTIDGYMDWSLHGKPHRTDGPSYVDLGSSGNKAWSIFGREYFNMYDWAEAALKYENKPHDADSVKDYVRWVLNKEADDDI